MSSPLPIAAFRDRIVSEIRLAGILLITGPTGSGKSTQTPQYLMDIPGKILVLEPRRRSARSLAARVAAETGTALGEKGGYQVRFDNRCSAQTKVVFQTYGVFVQQLLREPELPGVGAVLLDEFHERTLECDLALAWVKALRQVSRPDLKAVVMSATLAAEDLGRYLPQAVKIACPEGFDDIRHQPMDAPRTRGA